jgi:hypothetical protein
MAFTTRDNDRFGFCQPLLDVHTMGLVQAAQLLEECGYAAAVADRDTREAIDSRSVSALAKWVRSNAFTALGFAYRLSPQDGLRCFTAFVEDLRAASLLSAEGGPVRALFFAGLPETCELVSVRFPSVAAVFPGDETPAETLRLFGVPPARIPASVAAGAAYDDSLLAFGRDLVSKGEYSAVRPVDRSGSPRFGQRGERLADRLAYGKAASLPPLVRSHMGPYLPDRREAVSLFYDWTRRLAASGMLDVLSIGTSQLSQSRFGDDWGNAPNGGGVPIALPEEYEEAWKAARPMLVRTYSGTRNVEALARMYEERLDIAWHALSFWWFCGLDGRGPNSVADNLAEHHAALRTIAASGKPFEPNVPHHFAFRGADDVSYVVSGYLAVRAAKDAGIRLLVLQTMLNTPKSTWGIQDLAKARALLSLARSLEGPDFRVALQPRGGLDYFSKDIEKAKAQLAAVTALMDDIEAGSPYSPEIIHVVGYSEAVSLADPDVIDESVRIVRHALETYRRERARGNIADMGRDAEVYFRTRKLIDEARLIISAIEKAVPDPYSAAGMYEVLASGFLAAPHLSFCRDEFEAAATQTTRSLNGGISVVDSEGSPVSARERARRATDIAMRRRDRGTIARPGRSR